MQGGMTRTEEVLAALTGAAGRGGITAVQLAVDMGLTASIVRPVLSRLFRRNLVTVLHGINKSQDDSKFYKPVEFLWLRRDERQHYVMRPEAV